MMRVVNVVKETSNKKTKRKMVIVDDDILLADSLALFLTKISKTVSVDVYNSTSQLLNCISFVWKRI